MLERARKRENRQHKAQTNKPSSEATGRRHYGYMVAACTPEFSGGIEREKRNAQSLL